ncbi:hypothetical protein Tco_0462325 [Tanacetum coccineum]
MNLVPYVNVCVVAQMLEVVTAQAISTFVITVQRNFIEVKIRSVELGIAYKGFEPQTSSHGDVFASEVNCRASYDESGIANNVIQRMIFGPSSEDDLRGCSSKFGLKYISSSMSGLERAPDLSCPGVMMKGAYLDKLMCIGAMTGCISRGERELFPINRTSFVFSDFGAWENFLLFPKLTVSKDDPFQLQSRKSLVILDISPKANSFWGLRIEKPQSSCPKFAFGYPDMIGLVYTVIKQFAFWFPDLVSLYSRQFLTIQKYRILQHALELMLESNPIHFCPIDYLSYGVLLLPSYSPFLEGRILIFLVLLIGLDTLVQLESFTPNELKSGAYTEMLWNIFIQIFLEDVGTLIANFRIPSSFEISLIPSLNLDMSASRS